MRTFQKVSVVAAVALLASSGASAATLNSAFINVTCAAPISFSASMGLGARSVEVMNLQKILNISPLTRVSLSGAGSPGLETSYFGPATRAALVRFQNLHLADTRPTGFFGPLTRQLANMVCKTTSTGTVVFPLGCSSAVGFSPVTGAACSTTGTVVFPLGCSSVFGFSPVTGASCSTGVTPAPITNTGPVSVAAASVQPNAILISGQSGANLGEFVFTGNGTIANIEFMRIGASSNNTISNVYLYEGATRLTDASSVLTNGAVRFTTPWTVNGTRRITVRGDVALNTGSQVVGVAVTGITMSGSTVSTPVVGVSSGLQTISAATMATANFTTVMPSPLATSINAGSMNQNLWSNSLNVGIRSAKLKGFTVKMIGSAPSNTLANVGLFINGSKVASATADANMRFVFDMMSNPVNLSTGSQLIEVRGDVVGGANRNFYVVLEQAADVMLEDSQLAGANLTVTNLNVQLLNMQAGLVTVQNGTLVINQDTTFNNTTTVVGGASNVKLAAFKFTSYGEDVKVNTLTFMPVFTGLTPAGTTLANVGLYVNGGQVSSQQTATNGVALQFVNLGSNLIANTGVPVIVEIRGDVVNATNVAYATGQVRFDLVAGTSNAQGVQSSQLTGTASAAGQNLTVSSSNVTISNTAGFAASTKAPNTQNVKIGSFTVNTASAEGVTITNVSVALAGTMVASSSITNLTVKDGSNIVGTPIGNPVASGNNFSANVVVPQSSTKVLEIYADLGSNATGLTVTPTVTITTRGSVSNLTTIPTPATGSQTLGAVAVINTLGVTFIPASSPVAQYIVGPATNLAIANFNIKTSNNVGGGVIRDVTFTVPMNTISSITMNGKTASVVGTTAVLYDVNLTVPADNSGINVPATVALVCTAIGSGCAGTTGSPTTLSISSLTYNDGSMIQTVVPASAITPTHVLAATKPTITMAQSNGSGLSNSNLQIGTITVGADAAGDIKLQALPIDINLSGAGLAITAGSVQLRDSSGTTQIVNSNTLNGSGTFTITSGGRTISKGTSETYTIWATFTGVAGAANTMSATTQAGLKANFLWTDVAGNVAGLTGTPINNYPVTSQTRNN